MPKREYPGYGEDRSVIRTIWTDDEGKIHREDGPAVENSDDSYKAWYKNGQLHREDGPAQTYGGGEHNWYYNGKFINCNTQEEFERLIKLELFW